MEICVTLSDNVQKIPCQKSLRRTVFKLKLMEICVHGLDSGAAGTFAAMHHTTLGPYYGDKGLAFLQYGN